MEFFSPLALEADLADLLDLFVGEMPDRVHALQRGSERGDYTVVAHIAHQLKGSAASYGFVALTKPAALLEQAARNREPQAHILDLTSQLVDLCGRCRAGLPSDPADATM
jgi:HPt (histidine-containing phosphotransfer) domain-containing protein